MTSFTSHPNRKSTFYTGESRKTGLLEKVAVVVSVAAIALFIVVDVVRTAPPDAPATQTSFDVAPDSRWAAPASTSLDQWAADDAATGVRPDSIH